MIKLKEIFDGKYFYHVTSRDNLNFIKQDGLIPATPSDMADAPAVYLFTSIPDVENAMMGWLGDRFDDEDELVLLTINPKGLKLHKSTVDYEILSYDTIPPKNIVKIQPI